MTEPMSFACGIAILVADQWSKKSMQARAGNFQWGGAIKFHIVPHRDKIFERSGTRAAFVATWILAVACAATLHVFVGWFHSTLSLASLGLALGGSASNLIDIIGHRCVVNYIDLGWWPVFNLADVAILAGLAGAFLL
jgi:lipoprotein signal peptidase